METTIAPVSVPDSPLIEKLTGLEKDAFGTGGLSNPWLLVPFVRHGRVYALYAGGQLAGGSQLMRDWRNPDTAYLFGISIDKSLRGKGLGTEFTARTVEAAKNEGIKTILLTVDPANTPAVNIYRNKLGFRTVDELKAEYGPGEDRLLMELNLDADLSLPRN